MNTKVELKDIDFPNHQRKLQLHTGLNEEARSQVVSKMKGVLADSYLLMLKTQNYHWNVKGTLFKSLHDLTEQHYNELFESIDDLAERIRALGHEAPGSFSAFQSLSQVQEAKSGLTDLEMAGDLLDTHETIIMNVRETLRTADEFADEVTVDMMVNRLTVHDRTAVRKKKV